MPRWLLYAFVLIVTLTNISAYKIIFAMILPGKSHGILGENMVRHLLNSGHEVTYITPFPPKPHKNLTIIDNNELAQTVTGLCNIQEMMEGNLDLQSHYVLMTLMLELTKSSFKNADFQKLLNDHKKKFDLMILEWVHLDFIAALSGVYDCPYIWLSTLEPHWMALRLIDDMPNPAYVSDPTSNNAPPFNFKQRVQELINQIHGSWLQNYYLAPEEEKVYEEYIVPHIRSRNLPVPPLSELKFNASLMFGNSHVSLGEATRLPQNYIPVGGFHIEADVKPLPDELQKIMENAEHGVIYFSMGSNLRSKDIPEVLTQEFLNIFSKLKQTVIWKFETDLPNRPKNVHIVHWAPQQSILSHPKTLFFISHGGMLSTTESVHFGVPMITIPVMVDQFVNAKRAVRKGYAIKVDISYTMAKDFERAIHTMLTDPKYKTKAKELAFIYHKRPLPPSKEIVHWVDLVVQTRGASHLRSPALRVAWYQKLFLDLLAVILIIVSVIIYIIRIILTKSTTKDKEKKNN